METASGNNVLKRPWGTPASVARVIRTRQAVGARVHRVPRAQAEHDPTAAQRTRRGDRRTTQSLKKKRLPTRLFRPEHVVLKHPVALLQKSTFRTLAPLRPQTLCLISRDVRIRFRFLEHLAAIFTIFFTLRRSLLIFSLFVRLYSLASAYRAHHVRYSHTRRARSCTSSAFRSRFSAETYPWRLGSPARRTAREKSTVGAL